MSRMRRMLRLAAVAGLAAAGLAIGPAGAAHASPTHVGIVIAGDKTACVAWHSGMTGDDVLHAVAKVTYRYDGLIVQIDGKPSSGTADNTHYWRTGTTPRAIGCTAAKAPARTSRRPAPSKAGLTATAH